MAANRIPFDRYLLELRKTPIDKHTEHTGRTALENLLQTVADAADGKITVQHEPKREAEKGAPDYKVTKKGLILGYVENKAIGENLDKVLKSDQIKKYRSLSQNIVLTDYLHFIWINKDGVSGRETLCHATDLEHPKFRLKDERIEAVRKLLEKFFSTAPEGIGKSQQLALALATRSRLLKDYLGEELVRQERDKKGEKLIGLYEVFRDQVFHELSLADFADAFAQMLAYGLFLARLNSENEEVTLHNAREHIPGSFRLIRELVDFLTELEKREYRDVKWVVEEVLSIVNSIDLAAIHNDLSFRGRKAISRRVKAKDEDEHRLFERDPFIYFYEDYLKAYDKHTRKGRGVYYTPPPIVNFIIRAIDDILKDTFEIRDGLADNGRVTVLDFACGTGTFLLEVFEKAFDNIGGPESGRADALVREHFLKNIYGFEYLIASYTIAHLKLSQYLKDKGHPLTEDERLQVFLTNTLEPIEPQTNYLVPAITAEVEAAQAVKDKPILVITGNPPYSGHSKNKGFKEEIGGYKYTVETDDTGRETRIPLGERNPKWLNDDYVKFIRFAQLKMDAVPEGIVAVITNHSWLDNPTFRGMRQSLIRTFEQIYVLDLHGNYKKKETAPDGSKDENVFDIEQGVAISVFVKKAGIQRGIWRGDVWGRRLQKYQAVADNSISALGCEPVNPTEPHYLFQRQDERMRAHYDEGLRIVDIMPLSSVGFVTSRDHLAIAFSEDEMNTRLASFVASGVEEARIEFNLGKDVRDWKVEWAQNDVRTGGEVIEAHYRPFDRRFTFYSGRSRGFLVYPRDEVSRQLLRPNVALITSRLTKGENFRHVQVTDKPAEVICLSPITSNNGFVFPLRVDGAKENLSPDFRSFLNVRYDHHYSPEEILGYIYAVLHAPTYRTRYSEFLRIDFPRIPFPEKSADFDALSKLGWALVQAHLFKSLPRKGLADFKGRRADRKAPVEKPRYSPEEQAIWINGEQRFEPVQPEVWNFHIGGYQVLDKYLKSRKGRELSLDEINHVAAIADSLAFTIDQMGKIDGAYRAAFPDKA